MPQAQTSTNEISSRDKILDAAEALFARRGYAGVGLRELSEMVGLGKSSLFHHFRSKPELYAAVCARILGRIEQRLEETLVADGTPPERLEAWLDALTDLLATNPTHARLLLRSLFEDDDLAGETPEEQEAQRAIGSVLGSVSALLREGMGSGHFRAAHVPHLLLTLVGQVVFPFASGDFGQELLGKDVFDDAEVRRRKQEVRDLLRFGLMTDAGRPPRT